MSSPEESGPAIDQPASTNPPEVVLKPLPPEEWPSIDHIITEDGAPVDNVFSEKQMRLLTEPLYSSWDPGHPFVALANVGVFYGVDLPPLVPDALLSLHVRMPENLFPKINRSYFVWKYGKPPEVAIEVVSNKKGGEDTEKLRRYADMRASNYIIFDPEHHLSKQDVRWFTLQGNQLRAVDAAKVLMPEVGLGLSLWTGEYESTDATWLRWTDLDGTLIPTGQESASAARGLAESEAQRAESEAQRAESEAQRADQATAELERLREQLRRRGIDPSKPSGEEPNA